jgi:hypothetical protein
MHGDETVGREMLVHLIDDLTKQYGSNDYVTKLIDSTNIYILVSILARPICLVLSLFIFFVVDGGLF